MQSPFMTVADVRLIEKQVQKIIHAKSISKDQKVIDTVRSLAVSELHEGLTIVDENIIHEVEQVEDRISADLFINSLKMYTIPFKLISHKGLQSLFKKDKKLKLPNLDTVDWQGISYLSWIDKGTNRQYIVIENNGEYTALRGVADMQNHTKGICAICNQHGAIHMFTATVKGHTDAYKSYSNYICDDVNSCNAKISDYAKLEQFVERNLN